MFGLFGSTYAYVTMSSGNTHKVIIKNKEEFLATVLEEDILECDDGTYLITKEISEITIKVE